MKRSQLFRPGFAARLHKEAAMKLYGAHDLPTKSESAAGKLAATLGATAPKAVQNAKVAPKRPKVMRVDPRQMNLKL